MTALRRSFLLIERKSRSRAFVARRRVYTEIENTMQEIFYNGFSAELSEKVDELVAIKTTSDTVFL